MITIDVIILTCCNFIFLSIGSFAFAYIVLASIAIGVLTIVTGFIHLGVIAFALVQFFPPWLTLGYGVAEFPFRNLLILYDC
ncbi:hypothetical protein L873DRAFT_1822212 [Choiromyces venosus 120613-1]|uniref:Uncharacterized protein n=1 Tax=Choiromyces venosus 120613-1 TaxID=1336337 RepID=A0A3N4IVC1_9PEZI|nr:hypothetical protein L873DRAFT_1822212 [Choiromyces venosus 120613-1]